MKSMRLYFRIAHIILGFLLLNQHYVSAQKATKSDTLSISLHQAEIRFLDSNYLLLASHYNIDAQRALVEQAKCGIIQL